MKQFLKNTAGNVAITSALMFVPLLAAGGAALDYATIYKKSSYTQNAIDAAILYSGTQLSKLNDDELKAAFQDSLQSNLTPQQAANISDTIYHIDRENGTFQVSLISKYPTRLMRVVGVKEVSSENEARVQVGSPGGAEIILALDTTRSMADENKIGTLKATATNFVTEMLLENKVNERVKIGVVPFERYVNIGLNNRNASWLDVEDDSTQNICREIRPVISSSGCVAVNTFDDGVITGTRQQCSNVVYGEPEQICQPVQSIWRGCVGSRNDPLNIRDSSYGTRVPGLMNIFCTDPILPLTSTQKDILDTISNLTPSGSTYMAPGMTWALRAISDRQPFSEGVSFTKAKEQGTKKIIILMTDGTNTHAPNTNDFSFHDSTGDINRERANTITLEACDEAKRNEVLVYTIGFGEDINEETRDVLRACASDNSRYYDAADAQNLQLAFNEIQSQISGVYLSK